MSEEAKPWDRLPDEPVAAYTRFLIYRSMGPGRSVEAAYTTYAGPPEEGGRRRVPGQWERDCATFRWVERASAWDVENLAETGKQAVLSFVAAIEVATAKALRALKRPEMEPLTFEEAIKALDVLGKLIPAATVRSLVPDAGPPPGASPPAADQ